MNAQIKQRAKDIVKSDMTNILIGTAIFAVASLVASALTGNIIGNALAGLINAVAGACSACFYFRAYNRGNADITDTFALLKDNMHLAKILTIMLAMWLVNTLISIVGSVIVIIPIVGAVVYLVTVMLIGYMLRIVWYLFVANPEYPTEYYLKGSVRYMSNMLAEFFIFSFSVTLGPALIEFLLTMFLGDTIAGILCIPFDAYISLAIAGFVTSIIPDEWYSGTAVF